MDKHSRPVVLGVARIAAVAAFALSACRAPRPPTTEQVSSTDLTSAEYDAAYRLAAARCATTACPGFPSPDACINAEVLASAAQARLENCTDPIDPARLERCVADLRGRQCGADLRSVETCRRSDLCPNVPEEGTQ